MMADKPQPRVGVQERADGARPRDVPLRRHEARRHDGRLLIVGGLVPSLIIDQEHLSDDGDPHVGTMDL